MDNWENIKEALKMTGGKYILAEKGEPSYVIVELSEYVNILKGESEGGRNNPTKMLPVSIGGSKLKNATETGTTEEINRDVNVWKNLQDKRILKKLEAEDAISGAAEREWKKESYSSENGDLDLNKNKEEEKIVIEEI